MAAVTKKFRWTNKNGESIEVDIGADGANIDVDGKSLPEILEEIKNMSGNIISESGEITTDSMEITLSTIPIEGMYYIIPPQLGTPWDTVYWGSGSFNESGSISRSEAVAQGEAVIIKYNGGYGDTGANAFDIVASFHDHNHENLDVLNSITADKVKEIEDGINTAKVSQSYNTTPTKVGTWIDGTPIWRWTFKETVDEIDLHYQEKTIMPPLNNTMNYFVINTFAQTYCSSPNIVDDKVVTYTDTGNYKMSSTLNVDGVYGWVEFVTPESNIK